MLDLIKSDIERYNHDKARTMHAMIKAAYTHPSFIGLIWYRVGRAWWLRRKNPIYFLLLALNRLLYPLIRMYSGLELSPRAEIGPGLYVAHFGPTVIHPATKAGRSLTVLQGVTIGEHATGVPQIGDYVSIGTGASVIGGIRIGDNATIGAGAVVVNDVADNCTVVGIPAKPIRSQQAISTLQDFGDS